MLILLELIQNDGNERESLHCDYHHSLLQKTHWFWVIRETQPSDALSPPRPAHYTHSLKEVESALAEGMRGLLIYQEVQHQTNRSKNR